MAPAVVYMTEPEFEIGGELQDGTYYDKDIVLLHAVVVMVREIVSSSSCNCA